MELFKLSLYYEIEKSCYTSTQVIERVRVHKHNVDHTRALADLTESLYKILDFSLFTTLDFSIRTKCARLTLDRTRMKAVIASTSE